MKIVEMSDKVTLCNVEKKSNVIQIAQKNVMSYYFDEKKYAIHLILVVKTCGRVVCGGPHMKYMCYILTNWSPLQGFFNQQRH